MFGNGFQKLSEKEEDMKILFINKYDVSGGAAIAAWRLHERLESSCGTEDAFLVGIKRSPSGKVHLTRRPGFESIMERGINLLLNKAGLQYVWFPFSTGRIRRFAAAFKPDIIALQNIHGGYFQTTLVAELSSLAPVVWTLHDMWAFTGNAAYTFGDERWKQLRGGKGERRHFPAIGLETGHLLLKRKQKIYAGSRLTVVCPSRWLQRLAQQSPVFAGKLIKWIPNGIDTAFFCPPENKSAAKTALGIAPDRKVLLLSAEKLLKSDYKGGRDLLEILKLLDHAASGEITLLTLGHDPLPASYTHLQVKSMGYISEERQILQALQASDVYLHTARADNLPNTLIEAISCGVPCIAFDVGGCGEIVRDGENGCLIAPFDHALFADRVQYLIRNTQVHEQFSGNASRIARENFDLQMMSRRYFELFKALLA
jgi:glycosyltransferase involved in cell wall biosynthesis